MAIGKASLVRNSRHSGTRLNVFLSYAHRDERLRNEVDKHLSVLRRSKFIATWHDQRISPGQEIDLQIASALATSDLVLLLISPDFMDSDYCYLREMTQALKRHKTGRARVIPIILRPVDWNRTPLGKLLALPRDGRPVTTWSRRDEALFDVANGVRRAVEEMRATDSSLIMRHGKARQAMSNSAIKRSRSFPH
jgi:hypothetical protein